MKEKNKKVQKAGLNRRDFIKTAGAAAAVAGAATALPRLAKPVFAQARDHILVGRVQPMTGMVAAFSEPSPWVDNRALEAINKDGGIYIEELGKQLPITVKFMDSESSGTKAAEVGSRLIVKEKVDFVYVSSTPDCVNPVSGQAERYKVPCLGNTLPVEMYLFGGPYHWAFGMCLSVADYVASFLQMWADVPTNKKIGIIAANENDGIAFSEGAKAVCPKAGYEIFDPGRFPVGNSDFSALINYYKTNQVDIVYGNLAPPDFATFWRQVFQAGWLPKICTVGRALLFPAAVEAIGEDLGLGTSTECIWHPAYGFKSSLTGETAQKLCDDYEAMANKAWLGSLGHLYGGWEVVADVLRRAKTLDKEKIRQALAETNLNTIAGPVKMKPDNTAITPGGGLQWVKGKKFPLDRVTVSNGNYPDLPVEAKLLPLEHFHAERLKKKG